MNDDIARLGVLVGGCKAKFCAGRMAAINALDEIELVMHQEHFPKLVGRTFKTQIDSPREDPELFRTESTVVHFGRTHIDESRKILVQEHQSSLVRNEKAVFFAQKSMNPIETNEFAQFGFQLGRILDRNLNELVRAQLR